MPAAHADARLARLLRQFHERFGGDAQLFHAPGRVNLIGEHTDYNGGFVMPAAIAFYATVAHAARAGGAFRVRSVNLEEEVELRSEALEPVATRTPRPVHWSDYVAGVIWSLREHGVPVQGGDLLIEGDVPLGSGLSSSAALELAVAVALVEDAGVAIDRVSLARLCQQAENDYVGARCGIMDQFAAACGRAGHALLLDCRSLESRLLPLEAQHGACEHIEIVVSNTLVRHALASGEYNRRRQECEEAVSILARVAPGVESLRDVTEPMLWEHRAALGLVLMRRCRHVVSENLRVLEAAAALESGDLVGFGRCMKASHASLRDDYEVSCAELDVMVSLAEGVPGVYGTRMMGGGFGGCTVSLVRAEALDAFRAQVSLGYRRATGLDAEIYVCTSADGAERLA
jgi:galactokinase